MSKAKLYAQTLLHAQSEKTESEMDAFFKNFINALKEKKEHKLLPAIVREFEVLLERSAKGNGTTLIVRDAADGERYKAELKKHSDVFIDGDVTVVEDKTVVGGFIAKNARVMLDKSYKKGLVDMYKRLVA